MLNMTVIFFFKPFGLKKKCMQFLLHLKVPDGFEIYARVSSETEWYDCFITITIIIIIFRYIFIFHLLFQIF